MSKQYELSDAGREMFANLFSELQRSTITTNSASIDFTGASSNEIGLTRSVQIRR